MKLYITYACSSNEANNYSVIEAPTYIEASKIAFALTEGKFAFSYTEDQFKGQIERYRLTEIPARPQQRKAVDSSLNADYYL